MKLHALVVGLLLLGGCQLVGPDDEPGAELESETFLIVEQMPELLPGHEEGVKRLQQCARDRYPVRALVAGLEGRVFVQFVVDEQGNVREEQVRRGLGYGCDEVALFCVEQLAFSPGRQRGEPVRVKMSLPVTFKLE